MPTKKTKVTPEDVTAPRIEKHKKRNINDLGKVSEDAVSIPQTYGIFEQTSNFGSTCIW